MTRAVLIGATGLVGKAVLAQRSSLELVPVSRRALDPPYAGGFVHSGDWSDIITQNAGDVFISCLGTTIKAAGSQAAFRAIDFDMVLSLASAAHAGGTGHMIAVSSVGASADSGNFYLRTKGQLEEALRDVGFARLDIVRPGLLIGDRTGPARPGEALAMRFAPLTDAMMHGPLRRYRSIKAATVARAIVALALGGGSGTHIHEHDAIKRLAD